MTKTTKWILIVSVIVLALGILFGCKNDGSGQATLAPKKRTIDTTVVFGIYLGYARRGSLYGPVKRFIYDSVPLWKINSKDSLEAKMVWGKDSAYIAELLVQVSDSITARAVNLKNWNGRDTVVRYTDWVNKAYVFDTGIKWDSATRQIQKYMDTTFNKKDTSK